MSKLRKHAPETRGSEPTGRAGRRALLKRLAPIAILALLTCAFFVFGLNDVFTFDRLRLHHLELRAFVAENAILAALAYLVIYAAIVAASVPGALVLTITGGLVFGIATGTLLTVVGATLGAVGVFLIARTALGDWLRRQAGGTIGRMADGFRKDAFNYLLVLRLVPIFPFFLVNLAPAFLGVHLRTFIGATLIGIAPGTFVYSSLGAGLGSVFERGEEFSVADALTPEMLAALTGLAILAIIPVVYRRAIAKRS